MPEMPEAARIEPAKDAGRPHTQAVCGRPRTRDGDDSQARQALRVFCWGLLAASAEEASADQETDRDADPYRGDTMLVDLAPPVGQHLDPGPELLDRAGQVVPGPNDRGADLFRRAGCHRGGRLDGA